MTSLPMQESLPALKGRDEPFVVEYYYKVRWGHADEFIRLFKKNHHPVLKGHIALGRILGVKIESPRYHNTEDGRWDYRVTIVWKNGETALEDFDESSIARELFPDQETFKKEEQRRFEILLAHWDLPVVNVDLEKPR
jgi:heme-degrading monooxygenase HmoA